MVMATQLCEYIKTTEVYALNGWILCYMNYTSVKILLIKDNSWTFWEIMEVTNCFRNYSVNQNENIPRQIIRKERNS